MKIKLKIIEIPFPTYNTNHKRYRISQQMNNQIDLTNM